MLTAYFDESGIHRGDHLCVVAGFVGNDAQWQALIADWIPAIAPRTNLHLTQMRWKHHPNAVRKVLAATGPIPAKYNLKPVSVGMRWNDYEATMMGKVKDRFTNPYMSCAQSCIATVLSYIAGSDEVLFLFDRQHVHRRAMESFHDVAFKLVGVDSRMKGVRFLERKTTVCLDPADYLAYMIREEQLDPNSERLALGRSILDNKGYGGIYSRKMLEDEAAIFLEAGMGVGSTKLTYNPKFFAEIVKNPYWRGPQ